MKNPRRLFFVALIGVGLLVGAYFGAGYFVFNVLTQTTPQCSAPHLEGRTDNNPSEFDARYRITDDFFDASEYWMSSYEDVRFPARGDNVTIAGWFIPAPEESDYSVIVVHGINSCRRDTTPLLAAGMLNRNGFNVLMIDLRNHGDSEVTDGRLTAGNREFNDVLGAFDWLIEQGYDADDIGLMGISMGGGISIIAFAAEPDIPALWVDSPFSNMNEVVKNEFTRAGYPHVLIQPAFQVSLMNGIDFYANSPNEAILNHDNRPIFITHGDADERLSVNHSYELIELAGDNAELLIFEGYDHVEALYFAEEAYEEPLVQFFTENLAGNEAQD